MRLECIQVQVGNVVTGLVIALIESNACSTAKHQSLLHRLVLLRACEESSSRDANVEERTIVRPAIESSGGEVLPDTGKVIFEKSLDLGTARWSTDVECASIPIVDGVNIIGRCDLAVVSPALSQETTATHRVKVEVGSDLGCLSRR
jgi:hypothetical protein